MTPRAEFVVDCSEGRSAVADMNHETYLLERLSKRHYAFHSGSHVKCPYAIILVVSGYANAVVLILIP